MIETVTQWRIWRLTGGRAYAIMLGVWFVLCWLLGPISGIAYGLSMLLAFFGPTALFGFLFVRHWLLKNEYSAREGLARRLGCIAACGVTSWMAIETDVSYANMSDAPRGMLWDFYIVIAPILGMAAMMIAGFLAHPKGLFKKKTETPPLSDGDVASSAPEK